MKWKLQSWLLCTATALAVAAAVLLPPQLSALADGKLSQASYAVQTENMDVSLVYQLSTVERLALMAQITEESTLVLTDVQPAQDELTAEQAFALCQDELDALYQAGGLPAPFTVSSLGSASYFALYDRENPQRSVSYWLLEVRSDDPYFFRADLFMDAQTGLIYGLYLPYHAERGYTIAPKDLLRGWGEYLALDDPDLTEIPEVFPNLILDTDDVTYVEVVAPHAGQAEFKTDEGIPVVLSVCLSYSDYGLQTNYQYLVIAPFPEELL